MKKITSLFLSMGVVLALSAQEMPQPSPKASFTQRVGLTDISVDYARPGVKGRKIFGEMLPYGQLWRTGANTATVITFSTDVKVNGQDVKAGKYSIFTMPGETEWTIMLNKDTELWGESGYKQSNDVLRTRVTPSTTSSLVETMRISVENIKNESADIVIAWENTEVVIPVTVEVDKMAEANLNKALSDATRTYRNAADFYSKKGDYDKALSYINKSIEGNNYWYTNWMKAEILAAKGDKKGAIKQGELALKMGEEYYKGLNQPFNYKDGLQKTMNGWK